MRASADRYAAFREEFCHLEDGGAAERALAVVLGPGTLRIPAPARALVAGAR